MKLSTLIEAIQEAGRFKATAQAAMERHRKDHPGQDYIWDVGYTRQSASARRASVDLTRKLADLRAGR